MLKLWKQRKCAKLLLPPAWLYRVIVDKRNRDYRLGKRAIHTFPVPVISVGNLTVGGTGKTPLVSRLVTDMKQMKKKPGILSRGYKRKNKAPAVIACEQDFKRNRACLGDEPSLLFQQTKTPVAVGPDRRISGQMLMDRSSVNVLILDDAYQHRKIHRDINLLTIDATCPWGNGWMIPAGPLREPIQEIRRADAIVLTRTNLSQNLKALETTIRSQTTCPIFHSEHQPVGWSEVQNQTYHELDSLNHRFVLAFAGIGNPEAFRKTLEHMGITLLDFMHHPDHHAYSSGELLRIDNHAQKIGAVAVVTTEKDAIKIQPEWCGNIPVFALKIELRMQPSDNAWMNWLKDKLKGR